MQRKNVHRYHVISPEDLLRSVMKALNSLDVLMNDLDEGAEIVMAANISDGLLIIVKRQEEEPMDEDTRHIYEDLEKELGNVF